MEEAGREVSGLFLEECTMSSKADSGGGGGRNEVKIGVHDKKQFLHDCQCLAGLFHVVQV